MILWTNVRQSVETMTVELSEEERAAILSSEQFIEFIDVSSKMIERALDDTYDFLKDYRKESNSAEYVATFFVTTSGCLIGLVKLKAKNMP